MFLRHYAPAAFLFASFRTTTAGPTFTICRRWRSGTRRIPLRHTSHSFHWVTARPASSVVATIEGVLAAAPPAPTVPPPGAAVVGGDAIVMTGAAGSKPSTSNAPPLKVKDAP